MLCFSCSGSCGGICKERLQRSKHQPGCQHGPIEGCSLQRSPVELKFMPAAGCTTTAACMPTLCQRARRRERDPRQEPLCPHARNHGDRKTDVRDSLVVRHPEVRTRPCWFRLLQSTVNIAGTRIGSVVSMAIGSWNFGGCKTQTC